jgi:phosphatidate phosphatase LPIN
MFQTLYDTVTGKYLPTVNPSTLTGSIDVIVAKYPDGTFCGSPFHVRFGKFSVMNPENRAVQIFVNDKPTS